MNDRKQVRAIRVLVAHKPEVAKTKELTQTDLAPICQDGRPLDLAGWWMSITLLIELIEHQGGIMRGVTNSMVIAVVAFSFLIGCSTQSAKTVETEKTVHYSRTSDQAATDPVVEQQTTKTEETTQTDGQSVGVLSGTVHVVGQALALPFHVVGGLIGAIF